MPITNQVIDKRATEIVEAFEQRNGRVTEPKHHARVGYDLYSKDSNEERMIEIKGTHQSWQNFSWLSLHCTQVKAIIDNPINYFLYIVRFEIPIDRRDTEYLQIAPYRLFIIRGIDLLHNFQIKSESFRLPINQDRLNSYEADVSHDVEKSVAHQGAEDL